MEVTSGCPEVRFYSPIFFYSYVTKHTDIGLESSLRKAMDFYIFRHL